MLIVGLTGGIASGKSLVRGIFEELGAKAIDADQVSRDLVQPDREAARTIRKEFGDSFFLPDGSLDRRRMAEVIFTDPASRSRLEEILHPLIGEDIAARVARFRAEDPDAVVVVEAALLIEIGMQDDFDKLVVVYADETTRVERLMKRDGIDRHQASRRFDAQMPLESKLDLADFVIDNSGSPEDTRRQTIKVYNHLRNLG